MGLFNFGKKKERLLQWQALVIKDAPANKLIVSEAQLKQTTNQLASNHLRIIADSAKLVETTTNAETFFSRLDLLITHSEELVKLEPYMSYSGASPTDSLNEILSVQSEAIRLLIDRCYGDATVKADKLKTEKGKKNQYIKAYQELEKYTDKMDEANRRYLKNSFAARIE